MRSYPAGPSATRHVFPTVMDHDRPRGPDCQAQEKLRPRPCRPLRAVFVICNIMIESYKPVLPGMNNGLRDLQADWPPGAELSRYRDRDSCVGFRFPGEEDIKFRKCCVRHRDPHLLLRDAAFVLAVRILRFVCEIKRSGLVTISTLRLWHHLNAISYVTILFTYAEHFCGARDGVRRKTVLRDHPQRKRMPPFSNSMYLLKTDTRTTQQKHWTSHSDFMNGKVYSDLKAANAALAILTQPQPCFQASIRPLSNSRSSSASSTSTVGSVSSEDDGVSNHNAATTSKKSDDGRCSCCLADGVTFEVRKIAARSLCGSLTWWFVDDEAAS